MLGRGKLLKLNFLVYIIIENGPIDFLAQSAKLYSVTLHNRPKPG